MAMFMVYTDGSYRDGYWGAGAVALDSFGNHLMELSTNGEDLAGSRNVTGEIMAVMTMLRKLYKNRFEYARNSKPDEKHAVVIYHDYEGIQKWAENEWTAKKPISQEYKQCIDKARAYFDISFVKVKAHSGNKWNEYADSLASKGLEAAFVSAPDQNDDPAKTSGVLEFKTVLRIDGKVLENCYGSIEELLAVITENTDAEITLCK